MKTATACAHPGCRRTTTDPSGACHDHRSAATTTAAHTVPPAPTPAVVERWVPGRGIPHPTGEYTETIETPASTSYLRRGAYHRLDGPAYIGHPGRKRTSEEWIVDNQMHREDGPASIEYDSDGRAQSETYALRGVVGRTDGPAKIFYDAGRPTREQWWANGDRHRVDGPADIMFRKDGSVEAADFYVHGSLVPPENFALFRAAIEGGAPEEWALAFLEGNVG